MRNLVPRASVAIAASSLSMLLLSSALAGPITVAGQAAWVTQVPQMYWGATIIGQQYGDGSVPADMRGVSVFESHAGKPVSIIPLGEVWQRNGAWMSFPTQDFDNI